MRFPTLSSSLAPFIKAKLLLASSVGMLLSSVNVTKSLKLVGAPPFVDKTASLSSSNPSNPIK